eukprot:GFUD01096905.1.p1 GENE.GFUD01096905.1~~GFUD01096905.1.p1  ORF type:complete len:176 (-),score=55.42 GFUD01096905.1:109-588(-)
MWDFLVNKFSSSQSTSSSNSFTHSTSSSRRSSLSSSRPEFRPIHSEIIRRNLITDFLEATSLPVNVPIHRSREASQPSTPMREEFDRCAKQLPFSLASKLLYSPPQPCLVGEGREEESEGECWRSEEEEQIRRKWKIKSTKRRKSKVPENSDMMFLIEM